MKTGLVLSGGGARGAYQAGVIKALCEVTHQLNIPNPFHIVAGLSAGAINAAYIASHCHEMDYLSQNIGRLWSELTTQKVIRITPFSITRIGTKIIKQLTTGSVFEDTPIRGLIDTSPLHGMVKEHLQYQLIEENVNKGVLKALAVTATNYSNSYATTFVQTAEELPDWKRVRRVSRKTRIGVDHIMASSAIPLLFPAYAIDGVYYGDGGIRNTAPLSPAIHLGVDQVIAVGVCMKETERELHQIGGGEHPSIAHTLSVLIHGLLMDAIDLDIERLERLNEMAEALAGKTINKRVYNKIDYLWISPSKYIGAIAEKWYKTAPAGIRFFLSGLGSDKERADLFSYLLFEKEYLSEIVELGYTDAMAQRPQVELFLKRSEA